MSEQVVGVRHSDGALAEILIQRRVSEDQAVALAGERLRKEGLPGWSIYAVRPKGAPARHLEIHWKALEK